MIQINKKRFCTITTTLGVYDDTQTIEYNKVKVKKIINGKKWIDVPINDLVFNRCSNTFDISVTFPELSSGEYVLKFYSKDFNTVYTTLANVL
jgi:hypothetical protein